MEQHEFSSGVDLADSRPEITNSGYGNLTKIARVAGSMAGYVSSVRKRDILEDVRRFLLRSPQRSLTAAAVLGFVLGTSLQKGRQRG